MATTSPAPTASPSASADRAMPQETPPTRRAPSDAMAEHVARTTRTLQRIVGDLVVGFAEPRATDPARARWLYVRFAETITGVALGLTARQLASWLKRHAGTEVARAVRARMERVLTSATSEPADRRAMLASLALADEHRVTVALAEELRTRIGLLAPRLAALVEAAYDELAHRAPARARELEMVLEQVATDPTLEERLTDELVRGWPVLVALLDDADADLTPTSPLWTSWLSLVRGRRSPEALTPHDVIMVVR